MPKKRRTDSSKRRSSKIEQGLHRLLGKISGEKHSGDNVSTSDPAIFNRLNYFGRKAFIKLCDLGCDPVILNDYLSLLPPRKLPPKVIKTRKVRQIAKRANKLLADMDYLEKFYIMDVMFPLPVNDLTPHSEAFYATRVLKEMAELPRFIKEVWPMWNPTYVIYLTTIYNYVHKQTEHWKDALVADILNELFPHPEEPIFNEESLKIWRKRHGLTAKTAAK